MDPIKLSLKREELKVVLETPEGVEKTYTLREMSGRERDIYLTKMGDKFRYNSQGQVTGVKTFEGMHSILLERCLYDENNKLVSMTDLQNFPSRVLSELFSAAQKINALNQKMEGDEIKNASGESD